MNYVLFTRGIPASGKSTAAKKLCAEQGFRRVCLDDLREMVGDYDDFSPVREKLILDLQDKIILKMLKNGENVVVDATHLHSKTPKRIATLIWESGLDVEYGFDYSIDGNNYNLDCTNVPTLECLHRDRYRINHNQRGVGKDIVVRFGNQLEHAVRKGLWTLDELAMPEIKRYVRAPDQPDAIIVDIDGTLANTTHRNPYDYDQLGEDAVNEHVAAVVNLLTLGADVLGGDIMILLCSGREEKFRDATEGWLQRHAIPYDRLLMRKTGDQRRDSIIKLEIFDRDVRDNYRVLFAIDDRDRVVNLWRTLGVQTFQANEGDF